MSMNEQMMQELWSMIRQLAIQAAQGVVPKLTALAIITTDATTTSTIGGVTTTICKVWIDGESQVAANKRDCVVPVGDTVASGQLWLVGTELLAGHLILLKRIT